jgi:hypothetical protein
MAKRKKQYKPLILLTAEDRASIAEFERSSQAYVDRVTTTKESAMQALVDLGIYTKSGKLHKRYRPVA